MSIRLIEIEPNKWVVERKQLLPARSNLPLPYVISDIMPATEQVDGRFYESKSQFRAVGKALGLIEVGTSKLPPKRRATDLPETRRARQNAIKKAVAQYRSGVRPKETGPAR